MAGHNKWSKIKRTKGVADAKRSKLWTKLLREIQIAARIGGADQKGNPRLRDAVSEARAANMPKENIERAIKRGTGELEGTEYENITYEGYGPAGVAILIECLTDNRTRTVADVRFLLSRNGGNLGEAGSVAWMFNKKGAITLSGLLSEEQMMELTLEAQAEDFQKNGDTWEMLVSAENFQNAKIFLEKKGVGIESALLTMIPSSTIEVQGETAEQVLKLVDALEDNDDVQKVYANFDISDEELARLTT